jgi:hypothetical protein
MAQKEAVKIKASRDGKRPSRQLHEIRIVPGENGGATVHHHFKAPKASSKNAMAFPSYEEPEQYPFDNKTDVLNHLDDTLPGAKVMSAQNGDAGDADAGDSDDDTEEA